MLRLILAALLIAQATCYSVDLTRTANSASKASIGVIPRTGNNAYGQSSDSITVQVRNAASTYVVPETRSIANARNDDSDDNGYVDEIPGEAGVNYPIYTQDALPQTTFRCENQQYTYGYYADVDARCQLFHICEAEVKYSFLCPNGTIFSQQLLTCDWWFNVNCNDTPAFVGVNANFGVIPTTTAEVAVFRAADVKNSYSYNSAAATRNANAYETGPAVRSNTGYSAPAVPVDQVVVVDAARAASPTYYNAAPAQRSQQSSF